MKNSDIEVGVTYRNRGKGKTLRRVIAIGNEHRPKRFCGIKPPEEPGVLYADMKGRHEKLYLSSFAAWAGDNVIELQPIGTAPRIGESVCRTKCHCRMIYRDAQGNVSG